MTTCSNPQHSNHPHVHGPNCGHTAVLHNGHVDYLHDGHLHHVHGDHVDEHVIEVSAINPDQCTPQHRCSGHDPPAICMGQDAATKPCRTGTTWTTSLMATCIIRTATIATITAL